MHAPVVVSNASAPLTFHELLDDESLATADLEQAVALRKADGPRRCS